MDTIWQYQFRIILLGDSTVGKSSLLKRFTDGTFSELQDPTVGVDFYARVLEVEPGCRIKLQLWDTAGQERFRSAATTPASGVAPRGLRARETRVVSGACKLQRLLYRSGTTLIFLRIPRRCLVVG
ncbi:ras-related protein Rab-39B-like [Rhincodon typus]|uniref:ras-related protein Rab-39B-like n=1 Tax=Rhincodon typus TaxID=259920 RepID=UPI00202E060F|nr:ras-related protein Rab-39B-like [Rhincodon typus]